MTHDHHSHSADVSGRKMGRSCSADACLRGGQLMDGIGAAIFGVVSVLVIADLTSGTGRFNFTQGVVATATGLGASL
jgi:hypothetical protein